jgi:hypothetical protein
MQVTGLLPEVGQIESALESVKESLSGIKQISDMSINEQKAMNEKAKLALWNYYRISGVKPEELDDGASTS